MHRYCLLYDRQCYYRDTEITYVKCITTINKMKENKKRKKRRRDYLGYSFCPGRNARE